MSHSSTELQLDTINYPEAKLRIRTHVSTGIDPQTQPGVAFDIIMTALPTLLYSDDALVYRLPFGVVSRKQIKQLHNLLGEFLNCYPDE